MRYQLKTIDKMSQNQSPNIADISFSSGHANGKSGLWKSPYIPPLLSSECEPPSEEHIKSLHYPDPARAQECRAYWERVVNARQQYLPASLDREQLLTELSRSFANMHIRYPTLHLFWKRPLPVLTGAASAGAQPGPSKFRMHGQLVPLARWAEKERKANWREVERLHGPPPAPLPTALEMWAMFIIGSIAVTPDGTKAIVHFCLSNVVFSPVSRAHLAVLAPELGIPHMSEGTRFFWHGHPSYFGPNPPPGFDLRADVGVKVLPKSARATALARLKRHRAGSDAGPIEDPAPAPQPAGPAPNQPSVDDGELDDPFMGNAAAPTESAWQPSNDPNPFSMYGSEIPFGDNSQRQANAPAPQPAWQASDPFPTLDELFGPPGGFDEPSQPDTPTLDISGSFGENELTGLSSGGGNDAFDPEAIDPELLSLISATFGETAVDPEALDQNQPDMPNSGTDDSAFNPDNIDPGLSPSVPAQQDHPSDNVDEQALSRAYQAGYSQGIQDAMFQPYVQFGEEYNFPSQSVQPDNNFPAILASMFQPNHQYGKDYHFSSRLGSMQSNWSEPESPADYASPDYYACAEEEIYYGSEYCDSPAVEDAYADPESYSVSVSIEAVPYADPDAFEVPISGSQQNDSSREQ